MGIKDRFKGRGKKKGIDARAGEAGPGQIVSLTPEDSEEEIEFKIGHGAETERPDEILQPVSNLITEDEEAEVDSNIFSSIFNQLDEEDDSPVGLLIASLPDTGIEEVLEEARNLRAIIQDWSRE